MSFRGVKKVLYRTPHQILGKKSTEDELIKSWEHDLQSAIGGLEFLEAQQVKWSKCWGTILQNFLRINESFKQLHEPIVDDDNDNDNANDNDKVKYNENEEFSNITMKEIRQAEKLFRIIFDQLSQRIELGRDSFTEQCHEMKANLRFSLKLITKRNHKKIDLDMHYNTADKLLNLQKHTEKDKSKLEHSKSQLSESRIVFNDLDKKVKLVIPQVLETLSEFINKLTIKLYYQNLDLFKILTKNIDKFSKLQGLIVRPEELSYEVIVSNWDDQSAEGRDKLSSLEMLQEYKQFREKNLLDKTTHQANHIAGHVVGSTIGITSTLYTKAFFPNQKLNIRKMKIENPVKPYSREGMFITAADPINFLLEELRDQGYGAYSEDYDTQSDEYTQDQSLDQITDPRHDNENNGLESVLEHSSDAASSPPLSSPIPPSDSQWMKPLSLKRTDLDSAQPSSSSFSPPQSTTPMSSTGKSSFAPSLTSEVGEISSSPTSLPKQPSTTTMSNQRKSSYTETVLSSPLSDKFATETFKYTSVSIDSIRHTIKTAITKPPVEVAPVYAMSELDSDELDRQDIQPWISAQSTVSSSLFSEYLKAGSAIV